MGLGRFGGGVGITRWLVQADADVQITDSADPKTLESSIEQLADLIPTGRLRVSHGPHEESMLDEIDVLVVNPAVPMPWNNPFINAARSRGILVTTEIEIGSRQLDPNKIVAVTGSAGKSTTSAMICHVLNATNHHAILAGNIGGSLLTQLDEITKDTIIVLELSSAMLYWLWGRETEMAALAGPMVGCITNCIPNHLDWHGTESHYQRSKKNLLEALSPKGTAIIAESIEGWGQCTQAAIRVIRQEDSVLGGVLLGSHNALNAAMAVQAASAITKTTELAPLIEQVRTFSGLPHRLNRCHEQNGVVYLNDSKSTVPQATLLAVDALAQQFARNQIHLICGGYDKGSDLSSIASLANQLAGLYTIGATGPSLANDVNAHSCITLESAVEMAIKAARPGDAVLLSPGCASWDQFANYEHRGELFESLVKQGAENQSCSHHPDRIDINRDP